MSSIAFDVYAPMGVPQAQGAVLQCACMLRCSVNVRSDICDRISSGYLAAGQAVGPCPVESDSKNRTIVSLKTSCFVNWQRLGDLFIKWLWRRCRPIFFSHQQHMRGASTLYTCKCRLILSMCVSKAWADFYKVQSKQRRTVNRLCSTIHTLG